MKTNPVFWKLNNVRYLFHFHLNELILNPFHASGLFLYPLKTSENLWFPDVFTGYRKRNGISCRSNQWFFRSKSSISWWYRNKSNQGRLFSCEFRNWRFQQNKRQFEMFRKLKSAGVKPTCKKDSGNDKQSYRAVSVSNLSTVATACITNYIAILNPLFSKYQCSLGNVVILNNAC